MIFQASYVYFLGFQYDSRLFKVLVSLATSTLHLPQSEPILCDLECAFKVSTVAFLGRLRLEPVFSDLRACDHGRDLKQGLRSLNLQLPLLFAVS